jgi:membrane-associated phospholipid phosphatase
MRMGGIGSGLWERRLLRFRPEEWLFLGLSIALLIITLSYGVGSETLTRLVSNWRFTLIILAMGLAILVRGYFRHQSMRGALFSMGRTLREFSPLFACIIIYETLHDLTPVIRPDTVDDKLIAIDHAVLGVDPGRWLNDHIGSAMVTEILVLCYVSYGIATPGYAAYLYLKGKSRAFRDLSLGISLTAVLGYIGYISVPAVGPYLYQGKGGPAGNIFPDALPHFSGTPGTGLLDAVNNLHGTARDCFPSLHTAMTTVLLTTMFRNDRRIFWSYLPVAIGLYTATLYLRVHYAVDVAAGFLLATFVVTIVPKINDWWYARRAMRTAADDEEVETVDESEDDAVAVLDVTSRRTGAGEVPTQRLSPDPDGEFTA